MLLCCLAFHFCCCKQRMGFQILFLCPVACYSGKHTLPETFALGWYRGWRTAGSIQSFMFVCVVTIQRGLDFKSSSGKQRKGHLGVRVWSGGEENYPWLTRRGSCCDTVWQDCTLLLATSVSLLYFVPDPGCICCWK